MSVSEQLFPLGIMQATPAVLDLTKYPDALVTMYATVGQLVFIVGIICLIGGYLIGRKMGTQAHS